MENLDAISKVDLNIEFLPLNRNGTRHGTETELPGSDSVPCNVQIQFRA